VDSRLSAEDSWSSDGIAIVNLHGGFGAGCEPHERRFYDPDVYRLMQFDQRGCQRSLPLGELTDNTTQNLIGDIEQLRRHLGLDAWFVTGY
jgi:proline iminopeptidase